MTIIPAHSCIRPMARPKSRSFSTAKLKVATHSAFMELVAVSVILTGPPRRPCRAHSLASRPCPCLSCRTPTPARRRTRLSRSVFQLLPSLSSLASADAHTRTWIVSGEKRVLPRLARRPLCCSTRAPVIAIVAPRRRLAASGSPAPEAGLEGPAGAPVIAWREVCGGRWSAFVCVVGVRVSAALA